MSSVAEVRGDPERPNEAMIARALGGLWIPERPRLSEFAMWVLRRELVNRSGDKYTWGQIREAVELPPGGQMVHLRPKGGVLRPDIVLHERSDRTARLVIEVKVGAAAQWSQEASCLKLAPAPGDAAAKVRGAYEQATEPLGLTGFGEPGVSQIDAYFAWNWWERLPDGEPLSVDPDRTVYAVFYTWGMTPDQLFAAAQSIGRWAGVDLRMFAALLYEDRQQWLSPTENADEWDAIGHLVTVLFQADPETDAPTPAIWAATWSRAALERLKPSLVTAEKRPAAPSWRPGPKPRPLS